MHARLDSIQHTGRPRWDKQEEDGWDGSVSFGHWQRQILQFICSLDEMWLHELHASCRSESVWFSDEGASFPDDKTPLAQVLRLTDRDSSAQRENGQTTPGFSACAVLTLTHS